MSPRCIFGTEFVAPADVRFGGPAYCPDFPECNRRCRLRLGVPLYQANILRARERWTYPRSQGGRR